jgi:hypothetical protein
MTWHTYDPGLARFTFDCSACEDTGRCVQYWDGCGWEERPAREGEETFACRRCEAGKAAA